MYQAMCITPLFYKAKNINFLVYILTLYTCKTWEKFKKNKNQLTTKETTAFSNNFSTIFLSCTYN